LVFVKTKHTVFSEIKQFAYILCLSIAVNFGVCCTDVLKKKVVMRNDRFRTLFLGFLEG